MNDDSTSAARRGERSRRSWIGRKLTALVLSLITCAAIGELFARYYFREETDTAYLREQQKSIEIRDLIRPSPNTELFFELKPHLAATWAGAPVFTDNEGPCRRGDARAEAEKEHALKIAVLGDSTSFGWGVPFEATYAEVLRKKLESRFGAPVAVRNYSVPGYNTHQELVCFRQKVARWAPHLVILHYDHNDPDETNVAPPTYMDPEYGDNPLHSALIKLVLRRIRLAGNRRLQIFEDSVEGKPCRFFDGYRYSGGLYEKHLGELRELAEEAAALEIPVIAVIFDAWIPCAPDKGPHYTLLHSGLVSYLGRAGMHVLDLYPHYQAHMKRLGWKNLSPFWISPRLKDAHPNEAGHSFIASRLFRFIVSDRELADHIDGAIGGDVPP